MPNRLALETSPYLQQHRDNPVDWYPWGPEALERARAENKPILLSVGYSACHWCHVMAHESFENEATATIMNAHFVNVKVDREERPDIDAIYMQAVQAMTGQGGWPMTVFLTPGGEPFYGGTYFPPADRHGMPSFTRILMSVAEAWASKPEDIARAAASVSEIYVAAGAATRAATPVSMETLDRAAADLSARFEPMAGGFGGAPKFPQAMALEFLLRRFARTKDPRALQIVEHSFRQMARGGIYDQVGGGFHRYSVDARWLVPHFEKMLYDNALLARVGAHLFQITGDGEAARVTEETLGWVLREMTDDNAGWYSALDADSEHEEGKFYVWSLAELRDILGSDAHDAIALWGATESGNFEGANILHLRAPLDESRVAQVAEWKRKLYAVRAERVWPGLDNKIVASWNGLMLRAMAECARVFDNAEWSAAALRNGEFLWSEMVRDGRVYRTHTRGETRIPGFLEDQAAVALGLLALHQLTLDKVWFERAIVLTNVCVEKFRDAATGDFFDSASDAEVLITRPRDVTDNATPAGTSLAAELLLMVAEMTGDVVPGVQARQLIDSVAEPMARYATMFGHLLCAADMSIAGGHWADFVCGPNGCALP